MPLERWRSFILLLARSIYVKWYFRSYSYKLNKVGDTCIAISSSREFESQSFSPLAPCSPDTVTECSSTRHREDCVWRPQERSAGGRPWRREELTAGHRNTDGIGEVPSRSRAWQGAADAVAASPHDSEYRIILPLVLILTGPRLTHLGRTNCLSDLSQPCGVFIF